MPDEMFLAEYLVGQASRFLPPIEMLPLLEALKPVYQRKAEHLHAMKGWSGRRADLLDNSAKRDEALAIRRQLAEAYPHDCSIQRQYAQALVNVQEYAAVKAWLDAPMTAP